MRRLSRPSLPIDVRLEIYQHSKKVKTKEDGRKFWNNYRRSKASARILKPLSEMSGRRMRCFYCADSMGADVDHYWPIALKHSLTFSWGNWLLVCPNCNRHKSASFPLDQDGRPLLLDPSSRDPWKHFALDVQTGLIMPRYKSGQYDEIGEATLEVLNCLLDEAIADGRLRVVKRLRRAVSHFLETGHTHETWTRIIQEVSEDDYGVSLWLFAHEGARDEPFASFKKRHPSLNRRLVSYAMKWPYKPEPALLSPREIDSLKV